MQLQGHGCCLLYCCSELTCLLFIYAQGKYSSPLDLTIGFTELPLEHTNLVIQKPYDLPESARYSFVNGVHKLWVYSTDKPHSINSKTNPRTEIGIKVSKLICLA